MFDFFATLISWFYSLVPNYAVAIILLTVAVRLLLFPLTAKQARSMQQMQRVQPELKRLQQKYKNDRQKLNEEMMKFYKEQGINPMASCLPLLLQLPLFLILYRVISGLTRTVIIASLAVTGASGPSASRLDDATLPEQIRADGTYDYRVTGDVVNGRITKGTLKSAELLMDDEVVGTIVSAPIKGGKVSGAAVIDAAGVKLGTVDLEVLDEPRPRVAGDPSYLSKDSDLYKSLKDDNGRMESLGMDLSESASNARGGFFDVLPFYVLIALVVATGWYQQRQMTARNPQAAANPQMQMMTKVFPIMFAFISFSIQAGVVVYFVASNFWQVGQQALIFRRRQAEEGDSAPPRPSRAPDAPAKPTSRPDGRASGRARDRKRSRPPPSGRARRQSRRRPR